MIWMFSAGGMPMIPVAIVGLLAVSVGVRHASGPGRSWAAAASTLRFATLALATAGMAMDFATVTAASAGSEEVMRAVILTEGGSESLAPIILGAALAALSALFAAVGDLRSS